MLSAQQNTEINMEKSNNTHSHALHTDSHIGSYKVKDTCTLKHVGHTHIMNHKGTTAMQFLPSASWLVGFATWSLC